MLEIFGTLWPIVEKRWLFFATVFLLSLVGQVVDKRIFTRARAARGRWWAVARDTMTIHPIVVGALLGLVFARKPTLGTLISSSMLYMTAGGVSAVAHKVIEVIAEIKGWRTITLPGLSDRPARADRDEHPTHPERPRTPPPPPPKPPEGLL